MRHPVFRTIALIAVTMIVTAPQPAAALDLRDYMPWLFGDDKKDQPQDTLEAPFRGEMDSRQKGKAGQKNRNKELMQLYEKKKPMRGSTGDNVDQRHRSEQQMAMWVTERVANALSFKPGNIDEQFDQLRPAFTRTAYQNYRQSLQQRRLLNSVRNRSLRMNALVEDDPFLIEEGSKKGIYKWRFEVPVMISYLNRGTSQSGNSETMSKKLSVRLTITRKQGREKTDGVMIERWRIKDAG